MVCLGSVEVTTAQISQDLLVFSMASGWRRFPSSQGF